MSPLPLLAAGNDVGTLIEVIVVILVLVGSAIARAVAAMRQPGQPPAGGPAQPAKPISADVADEIDEFLRRAAQRRGASAPRPASASPSGPSPTPTIAAPSAKPIQAEPVVTAKPVGGQVGEHVQKYLDEQEFTRRAGRLGEEVAQTDREVDQHLHQIFDHSLSQLAFVPGEAANATTGSEPAETAETSPEALVLADNLLTIFGDPGSIRQAMVLNEVIHRPEERWQ